MGQEGFAKSTTPFEDIIKNVFFFIISNHTKDLYFSFSVKMFLCF